MGGHKPKLLEHEKVITPDEKDQLLAHLSQPGVCETRAAAAMNLVMKTGLRVSEVCNLQVKHCLLDVPRPMILVYGGKMRAADHADTVKIGNQTADMLREWLKRHHPRRWVFERFRKRLTRNTIWRDFKQVYAVLGFSKKYGVHSLRHRFITDTYKAFRDPVIAMNQARHKNLSVTTRYIHLATEESEDFREKLELV